ncbi:spore germination protein [Bacillaceae bacterium SIJ1]|uniref:spore germination protein n=1 Tax=Litoribacterium kuwaitense TaxID=1398745 RepID=UPI0013EAC9CE|nr:spore germination protein [Litoribacterium kuwaitense]NGP45061.1 spore germination protein [Litoribacterium kuwaitense]
MDSQQSPEPVFSQEIDTNIAVFQEYIDDNADIMIRHFSIQGHQKAAVLYLNGLADSKEVDRTVLQRMMAISEPVSHDNIRDHVNVTSLEAAQSKKAAVRALFKGVTLLFVDGITDVFLVHLDKRIERSVEEPMTEMVVRGPRIGFLESLKANTTILRQRANDPRLVVEESTVGVRNQKKVAIVYYKELANPSIVKEAQARLDKIDIDDVSDAGMLEQFVEDDWRSPFPQIQNTERPDRVIAGLLDGRVAYLLDGSPYALIVPSTFHDFLKTPDDYFSRWLPGSLLRVLRYVAVLFTLFLPALYISLVSFHTGLLPTGLAISIAISREEVPFPAFVEALIMEVTIELLREAGLRLPRPIGQTIGLVGGVIIGQAAVEAKIVSPIMIIIVAITAIASFTVPKYEIGVSFRILRFIAMIAASVLGIYGVFLFIVCMVIHLMKLNSFGVHYYTPVVPMTKSEWKDLLIRLPIQFQKNRSRIFRPLDDRRQR